MAYTALIIALSIMFISLQADLWIGKGSIQEVNQLNREIAAQTAENNTLKERNQSLYEEVKDLKRGYQSIEEKARKELGMVHKNETFFQIIE